MSFRNVREGEKPVADLTVLLTVYRRNTLQRLLAALAEQTIVPREVVVYHDCDFQRIPKKKLIRQGIQVTENSFNTRYHGRFAYLFNTPTEWLAVLDDDVIPGPGCLENYLNQSRDLGAIVGGLGRLCYTNPEREKLERPADQGVRPEPVLVDFVGQMWVFPKRLLFDMFSIEPSTYLTGEDMHLCFASKLKSGVRSYVAAQRSIDESCDVTMGEYAGDKFASFRGTPKADRAAVEEHFHQLGVNFITRAEQLRAQEELPATWRHTEPRSLG